MQELNQVQYCTASDRIINASVAHTYQVKYDLQKHLLVTGSLGKLPKENNIKLIFG